MSDTISHHCASHDSNEPERPGEPHGKAVRRARLRDSTRRTAGVWLLLAGCLVVLEGLGACGDRRIIFCESDFDPMTQACRVAGGAGGAGGGGSGGSSGGSIAGASGVGGASPGGAAGAAGGGTGGSAGAPILDASVPSDAGDAGALDAAAIP